MHIVPVNCCAVCESRSSTRAGAGADVRRAPAFCADPHPGNLLATRQGYLVYLDFGMMSEAPQYARYAIMAHVVHLVNRDYEAMCRWGGS